MKNFCAIFFTLVAFVSFAQIEDSLTIKGFDAKYRGNQSLRLVFYNVENLFDFEDDSLKRDDEFTPEGERHWSYFKYKTKLSHIAKTIVATGGWEPPAIVGLCEVENRKVLQDLINTDPIAKYGYEISHFESPDNRGIDVALIYRPDKFKVLSEEAVTVNFLEEGSRPTRDILYVKGLALDTDTLHVFVNHWPSRYGGHLATIPKRNRAASILKNKIDSICTAVPYANVVATGDFNDHPEDESVHDIMHARLDTVDLKSNGLVNYILQHNHKKGTHKFAGEWGILDQFFVSSGLFYGKHKLKSPLKSTIIFDAPFLLEKEITHLGDRPFRTYMGLKYVGGWSDHLPILLDIEVKE